jgi:hypothetical protein
MTPRRKKGERTAAAKVEHRSSSNQRFLVVILDVDINDVHRSVELAAAIKQVLLAWLEFTSRVKDLPLTIANSIVTSLLTSDNDISDLLTLLPSFRCQFNLPVPIKHLQQATGRVSKAGESPALNGV